MQETIIEPGSRLPNNNKSRAVVGLVLMLGITAIAGTLLGVTHDPKSEALAGPVQIDNF